MLSTGVGAVALARQLDDRTALPEALEHAFRAAWAPQHLERRAEISTEILALGEAVDDAALVLTGHRHYTCALLEQGNLNQAEQNLDEYEALGERFGSPRHRAQDDLHRAWIDLIRGDFDAAASHARAAIARGIPTTESFAVNALAMVGRAQGRMEDFEAEFALPGFRGCGLGSGLAVSALVAQGLGDAVECRAQYEALASSDFDNLEQDADRAPALAALAVSTGHGMREAGRGAARSVCAAASRSVELVRRGMR